ncbi:unnamed protein product, partial [Didymodactylos carnosus]
ITAHDLELFIPRMLSRLFIEALMYGNLTKEQALDYMTSIQQQFHDKQYYQPLFSTMLLSRHCLMLPEESCGDQLRTKEQLGYIVFSGYDRSDYGSAQGFYITIQSSTKLDYVNLRIETYIDSIREYITTMSDDVYYKQREGYIIKKLEIPKSMSDQTPNSVHRRKLAVHVVPSPLVAAEIIQEQTTSTLVLTSPPITPSTPMSKDDGKRIRKLQRQQSITSKTIATPIEKLTVEPVICNLPIAKASDTSINQTESTNEIMIENIMKNEKQLMLPETVWLENIPKWKNALYCYPLAQSYANIDLSVSRKRYAKDGKNVPTSDWVFGHGRVSNATVETYFRTVKSSVLGQKTNLRPTDFLMQTYSHTLSRMKGKADDLNAKETWRRRVQSKTKNGRRGYYFSDEVSQTDACKLS